MISARIVALTVVGALGTACVTSTLERQFAAGQYSEVARTFEANEALQVQERALYRAGLAYGLPTSPVYAPQRAVQALERLLALHPGTTYRTHALHLHELLSEMRLLTERETVRGHERDSVTVELQEHRRQAEELNDALATEKVRADALNTIVNRLNRDLRDRDAQIRALQEELAGLKEIDLNRAQSLNAVESGPSSSIGR